MERKENVAALLRATRMMDARPDSALVVLDSLLSDTSRLTTHFLMQCRLHRLNACNKLDTVFTSVGLQQSLVRYFDDEGTPNEQMLAYYLLARAHSDRGEAPAALSSFMQAAEKADTLAEDCNFSLLSRVYGQMGSVFYRQNLMQEDLDCLERSIRCAWKAKDTLQALNSIAYKLGPFQRLQMYDSVISLSERVYEAYCAVGRRDIGASFYVQAIGSHIIKGNLAEAKRCIDTYERETGYFDSKGNIEKGRETYYKSKGWYYLAAHQYDSAEYFFRKELREGKDFNNQNMASKRLAILFRETHRPDSAAKYALYSYDMNDSVYAHMATDEVEQMKALYNYTHHQEAAQKEKERAEHEADKAQRRLYIIVLIVLLACYVSYRVWKHRKAEEENYLRQVALLERTQSEVIRLRTHEADLNALIQEKELALNQQEESKVELEELRKRTSELNQLIKDKESVAERQRKELIRYQQKDTLTHENVESILNDSDVMKLLNEKSNKGQQLTEEEWSQIHQLVIQVLPGFYQFISTNKHALNISEYRTCILTRLHVKPSCISSLLDVSPSYISKIRPRLNETLFGIEGTGKDFDSRILDIC